MPNADSQRWLDEAAAWVRARHAAETSRSERDAADGLYCGRLRMLASSRARYDHQALASPVLGVSEDVTVSRQLMVDVGRDVLALVVWTTVNLFPSASQEQLNATNRVTVQSTVGGAPVVSADHECGGTNIGQREPWRYVLGATSGPNGGLVHLVGPIVIEPDFAVSRTQYVTTRVVANCPARILAITVYEAPLTIGA